MYPGRQNCVHVTRHWIDFSNLYKIGAEEAKEGEKAAGMSVAPHVLSFRVTLSDMDISSFNSKNRKIFKSDIGRKLGVPPAQVSLTAAAGSVRVDVSVEFADSESASAAEKVVGDSDAPLVNEDLFGPSRVSDVQVVAPAEATNEAVPGEAQPPSPGSSKSRFGFGLGSRQKSPKKTSNSRSRGRSGPREQTMVEPSDSKATAIDDEGHAFADEWFCLEIAGTNLVLDVRGGEQKQGTDLVVWKKTGKDNQLFRFDEETRCIRSKLEGGVLHQKVELVLDIEGASKDTGARIVTWTAEKGKTNQQWSMFMFMTPR